jgi:drug/metabolite transporter (DMT)-like permease
MSGHSAMPLFCLILACALWGLSFPIVKALHLEQSARIPGAGSEFLSIWMQTARFGLGALILLPFACRGARISRLELRQGILLGLWGGGGMVLQADGLAHTEASTSAFLTQAYCVLLPLIACVRTRRAPDIRTTTATILVVAGCAALSGIRPGELTPGRGEIETLLAAVLFTVQILTLENPRYRENRGLPITLVMCATIAAIFAIPSLVTAPQVSDVITAGASWSAAALIGVLALFCSVGAYLLMNQWQPKVSATEAGLIYTTEPLFTAVYVLFLPAWLASWTGGGYPNERFSTATWIGGSLIIAANVILQLRRPPHRAAMAPAP